MNSVLYSKLYMELEQKHAWRFMMFPGFSWKLVHFTSRSVMCNLHRGPYYGKMSDYSGNFKVKLSITHFQVKTFTTYSPFGQSSSYAGQLFISEWLMYYCTWVWQVTPSFCILNCRFNLMRSTRYMLPMWGNVYHVSAGFRWTN